MEKRDMREVRDELLMRMDVSSKRRESEDEVSGEGREEGRRDGGGCV